MGQCCHLLLETSTCSRRFVISADRRFHSFTEENSLQSKFKTTNKQQTQREEREELTEEERRKLSFFLSFFQVNPVQVKFSVRINELFNVFSVYDQRTVGHVPLRCLLLSPVTKLCCVQVAWDKIKGDCSLFSQALVSRSRNTL